LETAQHYSQQIVIRRDSRLIDAMVLTKLFLSIINYQTTILRGATLSFRKCVTQKRDFQNWEMLRIEILNFETYNAGFFFTICGNFYKLFFSQSEQFFYNLLLLLFEITY